MSDVDHPDHYNKGKIEVIAVIEDWKLNYNEGALLKYFARYKYKENRLHDLLKCMWHLQRLIDIEEKYAI